MVAYSFKQQFVEPIRRGLEPGRWLPGMKRQTIRADRARHARPGEILQLYHAMRTKQCFLIGRARCLDVRPININFVARCVEIIGRPRIIGRQDRDAFAGFDGFEAWDDMMAFWRQAHSGAGPVWAGVIVMWEPVT